jgi:cation transport ATPase
MSQETQQRTSSFAFQRDYTVYWIILAVSATLLWLLPTETQWIDTKRGWYTQPILSPAVGLSILALFSLVRCVQSLFEDYQHGYFSIDKLVESAQNYRVALIAAALFFIYVNTLSVVGFFLATLCFVTVLLWLSRLLSVRWFLSALMTTGLLILIFRVGVNVWLPDVALYELLPEQLSIFANQYL